MFGIKHIYSSLTNKIKVGEVKKIEDGKRSNGPINQLPLEILLQIFDEFDSLNDFRNVSFVSKKWNMIARENYKPFKIFSNLVSRSFDRRELFSYRSAVKKIYQIRFTDKRFSMKESSELIDLINIETLNQAQVPCTLQKDLRKDKDFDFSIQEVFEVGQSWVDEDHLLTIVEPIGYCCIIHNAELLNQKKNYNYLLKLQRIINVFFQNKEKLRKNTLTFRVQNYLEKKLKHLEESLFFP